MYINIALLGKLKNQLQLATQPTSQESIPIIENVQPTIDVLDFFPGAVDMADESLDLTVAVGTLVAAYTVPTGKRALLLFGQKGATTGSVAMKVWKADLTSVTLIAGSTAVQYFTFPANSYLDAGMSFGLRSAENGADGAIACSLWYIEYPAL